MEVGIIGLGKMGLNLVANMRRHDIAVTGYDVHTSLQEKVSALNAEFVTSLASLVAALPQPRIVWVMVPAGEATEQTVASLTTLLDAGDIIIDGGNSHYQSSIALYEQAKARGIHFFDCGSSGGQEGALNGGNFMIGGDADIFPTIEPLFEKISVKNGYLYTGPAGSGHYLKMVHNGIEYGMMQAIGEGFDLLSHSPYDYDYTEVAHLWNHGSVIRSWLMELCAQAFSKDQQLSDIRGVMHSSGEGKWTVEEALARQVSLPVITTSLMMRYRSLEDDTFTGKVVAALRNEFGGHAVERVEGGK